VEEGRNLYMYTRGEKKPGTPKRGGRVRKTYSVDSLWEPEREERNVRKTGGSILETTAGETFKKRCVSRKKEDIHVESGKI